MSRDSFSTCQSFSITYPKKVNKLKDYLDTTWLIVPPTFTTTKIFFFLIFPLMETCQMYTTIKRRSHAAGRFGD